MKEDQITFSFGQNWKNFLSTVGEDEIKKATEDINVWFNKEGIAGKTIIDIGCGSGIHSLAFYLSGAKKLISFDYDVKSVDATKQMWEKANWPPNWEVIQGSVLDKNYIDTLGKFEVVYSWGVLHHTGEMWKAIENAISLVNDGFIFNCNLYKRASISQTS